jgi:undecaprenyl diphosphate synthase
VAIDYSSREAIAHAVTRVSNALADDRAHSVDTVVGMLGRALTSESGDVDLLIRTGGEQRLSDFLLWESAYAELVFTDCMWPDFNASDLDAALREFRGRQRRFGGVPVEPAQLVELCHGGAR